MNKPNNRIGLKQLYFISFIEGGVVMVTEIAGAKLLTPYFGASLYSWASTLSITLLALMTGYYFGGFATTKSKFSSVDNIIWVFFLSGLLVLLMPTLGYLIMQKTISFSFFTGLIISELSFLFFPIFLMGMISPMIIFQITKKAEQSGRSAGNIYAISTCGGILFTLIFGFYIIPNFGITLPLRVLGLFVSIIALVLLIKEKMTNKKTPLVTILLLITIVSFNQNKFKSFPPGSNMRMVEYSEGLLGELKVIDELTKAPDGSPLQIRKLKTNNVQQNFVIANEPTQSLLYYVNFTRQLIKFLPKKESALLIGLGAGSLYSVLRNQNVNVETVEIDKRIYDIGVKYFGMPEHTNNVITDGRYFINVTSKKYDLIILDVIIGESVPAQLVTLESFQRLSKLLNTNGTLIIEHGGVNSFSDNSFIPSIIKTLNAAGFQVKVFNPVFSNKHGDLLFIATINNFEIDNIRIPDDVLIKGGLLSDYALPITTFDNTSANILTDDKNNSDILLKSHYFQVRKGIRKELAKNGGFKE
jgi:predicted membrane-bound spermidine synthase